METSLHRQLKQLYADGDARLEAPLSRYRIAKVSGVDASQLLRFMRGEGRLTNDSLDKIGAVLKLRLESDLEQ